MFRHHNYDQVVLLPMCYALARWRTLEARIILGVLACLFYVQYVAEHTPFYSRYFYLPEFLLLVGAGVMLYWLRYSPEPAESLQL